ncbi:hypothetical protein FRC08_016892 [Ceratobasidium sp. 394]|nr:hypothetical protein FRC08_016892 [Ceratobasidium sp. 394]KAG9094461.1 hypothetical protein FS749_012440 [Ceratobasidium sp. UAMH 11750]
MGRSTLQSAHPPSNITVDHSSSTIPTPTRSRPNLSGASTPSSSPTVSPLLGKALEATTASPGVAKSLNGLAQVGCSSSPSSTDKCAPHSGDSIAKESFDERVEAHSRRVSKGNVSTGIKPPPSSRPPAAPTQPERPHTTTDNRRNFGSHQGKRRIPTRNLKALLVTADSAPPFGSSDENEQLDYTANDSERFAECLQNLGFKPEDINIIKAVGTELLTYEEFMGGLDFLFSNATDGDVLVLLVSMHAIYIKNRGVYLKFVGPSGSVMLMGTRDLVDVINAKLRTVRCTVEAILDVCHAAGLIKCKYVIRQMESKTVVVSTIVEADAPPSKETSPLLLTDDRRCNEADVSASHVNLGAQRNTSKHINQAVVGSPSVPLPPLPKLAVPSASTHNNPFFRAIHSIFGPPVDLQTRSDILLWVAAREGQNAYERTLSERKNGTLVDTVCTAIEKNGYLSREEVFDKYVSVIIEEENAAAVECAKLQYAEAQGELRVEPQEAQLLSNRNYKERILKGNIFQAVPNV